MPATDAVTRAHPRPDIKAPRAPGRPAPPALRGGNAFSVLFAGADAAQRRETRLAFLARAVKLLRECATEYETTAAKVGRTSFKAITLRDAARAIEKRDMVAEGDCVGDAMDGNVLEDTGLYWVRFRYVPNGGVAHELLALHVTKMRKLEFARLKRPLPKKLWLDKEKINVSSWRIKLQVHNNDPDAVRKTYLDSVKRDNKAAVEFAEKMRRERLENERRVAHSNRAIDLERLMAESDAAAQGEARRIRALVVNDDDDDDDDEGVDGAEGGDDEEE